jgi:hypothetical protein
MQPLRARCGVRLNSAHALVFQAHTRTSEFSHTPPALLVTPKTSDDAEAARQARFTFNRVCWWAACVHMCRPGVNFWVDSSCTHEVPTSLSAVLSPPSLPQCVDIGC